jgi:hypothetical protein
MAPAYIPPLIPQTRKTDAFGWLFSSQRTACYSRKQQDKKFHVCIFYPIFFRLERCTLRITILDLIGDRGRRMEGGICITFMTSRLLDMGCIALKMDHTLFENGGKLLGRKNGKGKLYRESERGFHNYDTYDTMMPRGSFVHTDTPWVFWGLDGWIT